MSSLCGKTSTRPLLMFWSNGFCNSEKQGRAPSAKAYLLMFWSNGFCNSEKHQHVDVLEQSLFIILIHP